MKSETERNLLEQIQNNLCAAAGGLLILNCCLQEKVTEITKEFLFIKENRLILLDLDDKEGL